MSVRIKENPPGSDVWTGNDGRDYVPVVAVRITSAAPSGEGAAERAFLVKEVERLRARVVELEDVVAPLAEVSCDDARMSDPRGPDSCGECLSCIAARVMGERS